MESRLHVLGLAISLCKVHHLSNNTSNAAWSVTPNTRITSAKPESALLHVNYATECVVGATYMD